MASLHRKSQHVAAPDEAGEAVVDEAEDLLGPLEHGDHAGRLAEEPAKLGTFGHRFLIGLLDLLGMAKQRQFARYRCEGQRTGFLHPHHLGDVDRVLDDVFDRSVLGKERGVGCRPVPTLEAAAGAIAARDIVWQEGNGVVLAVQKDGLDRNAQATPALAVVRKHIEQFPADQSVAIKANRALVGLIDSDEGHVPVEDHVGRRQRVEQLDVGRGLHPNAPSSPSRQGRRPLIEAVVRHRLNGGIRPSSVDHGSRRSRLRDALPLIPSLRENLLTGHREMPAADAYPLQDGTFSKRARRAESVVRLYPARDNAKPAQRFHQFSTGTCFRSMAGENRRRGGPLRAASIGERCFYGRNPTASAACRSGAWG